MYTMHSCTQLGDTRLFLIARSPVLHGPLKRPVLRMEVKEKGQRSSEKISE